MANAASIVGAVQSRSGRLLRSPVRLVFLLIKIAVLAAILYLTWNHFHNPSSTTIKRTAPTKPQQFENVEQSATDNFLKQGDLTSYQISQQNLAQQYLLNNDAVNAERVMNEVFKNVPATKVQTASYIVMVNAEKAKKDNALYKHYLGLLINKLKAEGNTTLAAEYQKILDGL